MNKYLEKVASSLSDQRRFDKYIHEKPDYQGAWAGNIADGSMLGTAAVLAPSALRLAQTATSPENLAMDLAELGPKTWHNNKGLILKGMGAGAALGGAYGLVRHAIPARNHYLGYSDVPGVQDYAVGEVSPTTGRLAGGALGAMAHRILSSEAIHKVTPNPHARVGLSILGGIAGAKIGDKLTGVYNHSLMNRIREKHYEQ